MDTDWPCRMALTPPAGRSNRRQSDNAASTGNSASSRARGVHGVQILEGPLSLRRKGRHAEAAQSGQMGDGAQPRREVLRQHAYIGALTATHVEGEVRRPPIEKAHVVNQGWCAGRARA